MSAVSAVKPYVLSVTSHRANFSISLMAADEASALEHVMHWARKARLSSDGAFKLSKPDGSEIDVSDVVRPFLEAEWT